MELQPINHSESKYFPLLDPKPPKKNLSWYSNLFFLWIWPLVFKGLNQDLSSHNTIKLPKEYQTKNQPYKNYLQNHGVIFSVFLCYKYRFIKIMIMKIINIASQYIRPIYVKIIIWYVSQDTPSLQTGLLILITFIFCLFSSEILDRKINFSLQQLRLCVLNGIRDALCEKILKIRSYNYGKSINLIQTDVNNIQNCLRSSTNVLKIPIQIVLSFLFVYNEVGISMFAGLAAICIIVLINQYVVKKMRSLNKKIMEITDQRTRISKQTISEIRMIKAYAQQAFFCEKILALKMAELKCERIKYWLRFFMQILVGNSSNIAVVLIFVTRTLILGQNLTAEQVFVIILVIGFFQGPFGFFSSYINTILKANISANRIKSMLNSPDISPNPQGDRIKLQNCSFSYQHQGQNCLTDINLQIQPGSFIAIIGPVGSGKSSLLNSFMGELFLKEGRIQTPKNMSYAPSLDSWLMNTTLRENVTMGEKFNQDWFWKVINACGLSGDINSLKGKDLTEIGERGINLSGGQKARVCLARAVYAKKDIILMDDSLSSVDSVVAKEIFHKCLLGLLKNKTRILVTHRLEFAYKADLVIHMKEGKIQKISKPDSIEIFQSEKSDQDFIEGQFEALVPKQENETGRVDKKLYKKLVEYIGSWWPLVICFLMLVTKQIIDLTGSLYLKKFGDQESQYQALKLSYILKALASITLNCNTLVVFLCVQVTISKTTFSKMLQSLLGAPINLFYDITTTGRILNRLGADQKRVDGIAWPVRDFFHSFLLMISIFLIQFLFFPWLCVSIPFIFYASSKISKLYIHSSLQLERIKANTNSAILNAFTECLTGCKIIRCFQKQGLFQKRSQKTFDQRSRIEFSNQGLFQWMLLNLICIGNTFICLVVAMIIFFSTNISVGIAGLCLLYSFSLPSRILSLIRMTNQLENKMVAFQRIQKYIQTPSESQSSKEVPNWPLEPTIIFQNVSMSYRPNTPRILKNLSFSISSGLRVGLVGKTGSGKSSLFLSILRIVQLERGQILIGGQNIAQMKLSQLRKAITLIPQDPLVFQDSLRNNLDYQNQHSDQKILEILQKVNLGKFGLEYEIKDKGKNLSVGERQLLSIARSFLFKSKVVLVDEATAGIDAQNDELIQKLLRQNFWGCTMIVIAHRLNTILDSDQILVMDQGKLLEFGSPQSLLDSQGAFKMLVEAHEG